MRKKCKVKKLPHIWCHYNRAWAPMGRARKKCPNCGATISPKVGMGHQIKLMPKKVCT